MADLSVKMRLESKDFLRDLQRATQATEGEADALVKALARAGTAADGTARSGSRAAGALDAMGRAGGEAGTASAKLAGLLDTLAPGFGEVARFANDAGDALEVASTAGAGLGPAALAAGAAIGALAVAFSVLDRDIRREAEAAAFAREQHASLVPTLRALEDQTLRLAVATGQLTQAQADQQTAQQAALRGVQDFAAGQAATRAELQQTIESSERWLGLTSNAISDAIAPTGALLDAVFGWSDGLSEARGKLQALDQALQQEAGSQKALKAATIQTAEAQELQAWAAESSTQSSRAATAAVEQEADARGRLLRQLEQEADALAELAGITAEAETRGSRLAALDAGRARDLDRAAAAAERLAEVRGEEVASAELLTASQAVEADYMERTQALRLEYVDQLSQAQQTAHQEQMARLAREREAIVGGVTQTLGAISTLAGVAAEKQGEANAEAALRLFRLQKGAALAEVAVNTAVGVTKALATLGPIAGAIAAGGVVAAGAAQSAVIAAQEPPAYHRGGIVQPGGRPREVSAVLEAGEGVLTRRGVEAAGGAAGVQGLNRGAAPQQSREVVAVDWRSPLARGGYADALRWGDLRSGTRGGKLPGRR